ncbi:YraN family protein [Marininema halotolerans]|uniref:YraN family protein n=1 Tax=Marininema halotolerans TaxID=1155944 RepID=UPI001595B318|nr:YraN family protein [Marininema halotolerans]
MEKDRRRATGTYGEQLARRHLEAKGWLIRETNWRTRIGELDIVAEKKGWILFVEVRTTRGNSFGYGFQSVDRKKQQQVRRLVTQYLRQHQLEHHPVRIDVISILLDRKEEVLKMDHIEGAF